MIVAFPPETVYIKLSVVYFVAASAVTLLKIRLNPPMPKKGIPAANIATARKIVSGFFSILNIFLPPGHA